MAVLLNEPEPHIRLLVCRKCKVVDELPDFQPENKDEPDLMLEALVAKHQQSCGMVTAGGTTPDEAAQQERFLARIPVAQWEKPGVRDEVLSRMSMGYTGFEETVMDVRNSWHEGAMSCYAKHRKPEQCIDYKDDSKRLGNGILTDEEKSLRSSSGLFTGLRAQRRQKSVFLCDYCPVKSGVQEKVFTERGLYD